MPFASEVPSGSPKLVTSRTPVGPALEGSSDSIGEKAFRDALTLVIIAWAIVFLLTFSLRKHNV